MDEKLQTSFIPKKPLDSPERRNKSSASLFMIGSLFIFIVSAVLAGAVFGGKKYLSDRLAKDKEDFAKAQGQFDSITVEYLIKLSKKIDLAKNVMDKHIAVLPIFDYLQANTYKYVRFKSMDLSLSDDNIIELDMKGEAKNFDAVALQSDLFAQNKDFKNPIISDVDRASTGGIIFNFKTQIEPRLLLYKNTRDIQQ